jgi:ComF family protein
VPLHWRRRLARGFNQAELLARGVARVTGIPVISALGRVRSTSTQAGLSNRRRRQNVTRAFRSRNVSGKRILLIDDVMTTGATGAACAGPQTGRCSKSCASNRGARRPSHGRLAPRNCS